jgi:hypothetical protein
MKKLIFFWRFKNVILRSTLLSFLCSSKYTLVSIDSLHVCVIYHWLYSDLFADFFEIRNITFDFFKRNHL